ncbi:ComEC/Rec2 family competence protein [Rhizobium ruizarguesonis]
MRRLLMAFAGMCLLGGNTYGQEVEPPIYKNDEGEEIFGPEYMPGSPVDVGLPLFMGRPNAGVRIPDTLLLVPQDAFRTSTTHWSLPSEAIERQLPGDIPFLRDFRNEFNSTAPLLRFNNVTPRDAGDPQATVKVHYVDVGQGAGAIVELPCGVAVVDLGGEWESADGGAAFVNYLKGFLAARPQYNNTVNVVFISHPHADHMNGAKDLMGTSIRVSGVADNGQTSDKGSVKDQVAFREWVQQGRSDRYSAVEVSRQVTATGVTNAVIDPFACADVTAFWGGFNEKVGVEEDYRNPNNHSVIVRFDFGKASFLFMGDLEEAAADDMLDQYDQNPGVFDADVLLLAHHGAENGISDKLLKTITPRVAIISMGDRDSAGAKKYHHPRKKALAVLQDDPEVVSDLRAQETFWSYPSFTKPMEGLEVTRAIYGTGWEGTLIVSATAAGKYEIESLGH